MLDWFLNSNCFCRVCYTFSRRQGRHHLRPALILYLIQYHLRRPPRWCFLWSSCWICFLAPLLLNLHRRRAETLSPEVAHLVEICGYGSNLATGRVGPAPSYTKLCHTKVYSLSSKQCQWCRVTYLKQLSNTSGMILAIRGQQTSKHGFVLTSIKYNRKSSSIMKS